MTDWYVNSFASGGGETGLTPAAAVTNLQSLLATTSVMAGDVVWVSGEHFEVQGPSNSPITKNLSSTPEYHRWTMTVGWPRVGDPHYDMRPDAGISAGWDAPSTPATDVYTHMFGSLGYHLPIFATSISANGNAWNINDYTKLANVLIVSSSNAYGIDGAVQGFSSNAGNNWDNMGLQWFGTEEIAVEIDTNGGKLFLAHQTGNTTNQFFDGTGVEVRIRELIICSWSQGDTVFDSGMNFEIDRFINYSNSIQALSENITNVGIFNTPRFIRDFRLPGSWTQASSYNLDTVIDTTGTTAGQGARIDNYEGGGPQFVTINGWVKMDHSPAQVLHEGGSPTLVQVQSQQTNASRTDVKNELPVYQVEVNVTSGDAFSIAVPLFTENWSLSLVDRPIAFRSVMGLVDKDFIMGNPRSGTLVAGSASNWSGNSTANGSAWLFVGSFTAMSEGLQKIQMYPGMYNTFTSGDVLPHTITTGWFAFSHTPVIGGTT